MQESNVLISASPRDLSFLKSLDSRLRGKQGGFGRFGERIEIETFKDGRIIKKRELERALNIIQRNKDLAITPANVNMGFNVGFEIIQIYEDFLQESVMPRLISRFKESQLPKGYDFKSLKGHFMRPENVFNLVRCGYGAPKEERDHYDY